MTVGGAEVLAREFALNAREEFETRFLCLDEVGELGEGLKREGFHVTVLERKPGLDLHVAKRIADICKNWNVALIHAHQYTPFFYAAVSRLRSLRKKPPILFTEHGRTFPDFRRKKRIWANKLLIQSSDRIVAVGHQVRDALIKNEGLRGERIEIVYNGIDVAEFSRNEEVRSEVRKELNIAPKTIAVFCVARLNALKDHETAIRAVSHLSTRNTSIKLFLVGEGEERLRIESWIQEYCAAESVELLGMRDDVSRLINAADLFLLTSVSEGIPLTLIEAMAAGVPCVATNVGGVSEVIVHESTGFLAEARDYVKLSEYIIRLSKDVALRHRMGAASVKRAHNLFSATEMHRKYQAAYRQMAKISGR